MAPSDKPSTYLDALKSKPLREVTMHQNPHRKALHDQKGRCAQCNQEINPLYCKYVEDQKTRTTKVLCADCAINSKIMQSQKKK